MTNVKFTITGLNVDKLLRVPTTEGNMDYIYKAKDVEVNVKIEDIIDVGVSIPSTRISRDTLNKLSDVLLLIENEIKESSK